MSNEATATPTPAAEVSIETFEAKTDLFTPDAPEPKEAPSSNDEDPGDDGNVDDAGNGDEGEVTPPNDGETPPAKVKVGDAEYTPEELSEAVKARTDRDNWSKTNTQKAQELAALRKSVDPVVSFLKEIASNTTALSEMRLAIADIMGEDTAKRFDEAMKHDPSTPFTDPLSEEHQTLKQEYDAYKREVEGQKVVEAEAKELRKAHRLSDKQCDEVMAFAEKRFNETGSILTLDEAYRLMNYDKLSQRVNAPQAPNPVQKSAAAKKIEKPHGPKDSFDDIDYSGYTLFEDESG